MSKKRTGEQRTPRPRPGFEGVVLSAVPVWIEDDEGEPTKHYDTRIEFDDGSGPRRARIKLRPYEYMTPGTFVRVRRSYSGELSIEEEEVANDAPGASWRRPDIKSGAIALIVGVLIVAAVAGGAFLYLKLSQDEIDKIQQQQQEQQNIDPSNIPPELLRTANPENPDGQDPQTPAE